MTGIAAFWSKRIRLDADHRFLASTDLLETGNRASQVDDSCGVSLGTPGPRSLSDRWLESGDFTVAIAGSPIYDKPLDWEAACRQLREGQYGFLRELSGRFVIVVRDRGRNRLHVATDRIAQYPVYQYEAEDGLFFASGPGAFCRLRSAPIFNPRWLYHLVMCNFSPLHETFVDGARRLPAASVTTVDGDSGNKTTTYYAPRFEAQAPFQSQDDEISSAITLFADRVPRYLGEKEPGVVGLTSGFDSRIILSYVLEKAGLSTFTYGVPGCQDIELAETLAGRLGTRHSTVFLDESFEGALPDLMLESVWLSSGLQSMIRCSLLFAYRGISEGAHAPEVVLNGTSGDQIFRMGGGPSNVPREMNILFRSGNFSSELRQNLATLFQDAEGSFQSLQDVRDGLTGKYGDITESSAHLSYFTYVTPSEYFVGEGAIADSFMDYRSPFCDRDLLEYAWSSSFSTLGMSRFKGADKPSNRRKNFLSASLLAANPEIAGLPIQERPLSAYTSAFLPKYYAYAAKSRLRRYVGLASGFSMLEDWERWFAGPMQARLRGLLAGEPRVADYVRRDAIESSLARGDQHLLNKFATAEVILGLMDNSWDLDGLRRDYE